MPRPSADDGRAPFRPTADAFAFTNSWPHQAAVKVPTPFGTLAVGDAHSGLCGGMVFAALDYWYAGVEPPADRPGQDDPLYRFIVDRLVQSWHVPVGVVQYFQWMNLPDVDRSFGALGHTFVTERGVGWRTVNQQWPQVRADLDAGVPSPLGIVTVASAQPKDMAQNHQVLAWSYTTAGSRVTVRVYDPNSGQRDDVTVTFDTAPTDGAVTFVHTIDIGHPVRGFFRTAYAKAQPPT